MNRDLQESIVATFREGEEDVLTRLLGRFSVRDWRACVHWLDTSGLALYFLERVSSLSLEGCIPEEVLGRLRQNLADNRLRTADLYDEFVALNRAFQRAGLRYVNLKGFSLVPEYCSDPSLRCQLDLDFLVPSSDAPLSCDILKTFGYVASKQNDRAFECNAGMERVPPICDLYKPKARRSVEIHVTSSLADEVSSLLCRSRIHSMNGFGFPVLSDVDMFLAQALHLFKHLKSEWTRLSWLLEFKTFVANRRNSSAFWCEVRTLAMTAPQGVLAVGVATWLARQAFGEFAPRDLTEWSVDVLPRPVRLWLERYGHTVLLTDFPGTKLYLLLRRELAGDQSFGERCARRNLLFPLHRPPQVAYVTGGSISSRVRAFIHQSRFVLFRLKFHLVEGLRYLVEAHRWKRAERNARVRVVFDTF